MQTRSPGWLVVVSLLACGDASSSRTGSVSPTENGSGSAGLSGSSGHAGAGQGGIPGTSGQAGAPVPTGPGGQAGTGPGGSGGAPGLCEAGIAPSKGACTVGASFPYLCNPFTADTCDPGQECTLATWDYDYECTAPFGDLPLCAPCDDSDQYGDSTKTCAAGSWCFEGTCQRLCCDDGDCAAGHCQIETGYPHNSVVGFCKVD